MIAFTWSSYSAASLFLLYFYGVPRDLHSFPTRRSSDVAGTRTRHPAEPGWCGGVHVSHDVRRADAHARARAREAHDARIHRALAARMGCAARTAPHDAARDRDAGVHHRSRGAVPPRPALRLGGLSQPAQARDGVAGRSDDHLRPRPPHAAGVGEAVTDTVAVQHLPESRTAAGPHHATQRLEHRRGALPCPDRVPVFRRAAGREAHPPGHLPRSFGGDSEGEAAEVRRRRERRRQVKRRRQKRRRRAAKDHFRAARNPRAAISGFDAPNTAPITATPVAPASITERAFVAVIPPIPITGVPSGARRARAANPSAPSGAPASAFMGVAKQGPILQ